MADKNGNKIKTNHIIIDLDDGSFHEVLPDEHPFYAILGKVVAEWAHFEHALDTIIWELLNEHHSALSSVTMNIMGPAPRLKTILSLLKFKNMPDKIFKKADNLLKKVYDLTNERNRIIHDPWYISTSDNSIEKFNNFYYKNNKNGITPIDENEIILHLEKINQKTLEAYVIYGEIQRELYPSLEKLQSQQV